MKKRILAALVCVAILNMTACSESKENPLDSTTSLNQSSASLVDSTASEKTESSESSADSTSSEIEGSSTHEQSSSAAQSSSKPQSSSMAQSSSKPQSSSAAQSSSKPQSSSTAQSSKPVENPSDPVSSKIDWSKVPVVDEMNLDYKILKSGDIRYNSFAEWFRDEAKEMFSNGCVVITKYFGDAEYIKLPDQIEGKGCIIISNSVDWGNKAKAIKFSEGCCNPIGTMYLTGTNYYSTGVGNGRNITEAVIPDSWRYIGGFNKMSKLETVNIPKETRRIWSNAFNHCSELKSITIPENTEYIGDGAFYGCTSLKINFPKKLSSKLLLGEDCFVGCKSLTTVELPEGCILERSSHLGIKLGLFSNCTALEKAVVPHGVERVVSYMFSDCTSLTDVKLANSITNIDERAFSGCTSLKSIDIPDSVTFIEFYAFSGCKDIEINYKGKTYSEKNVEKLYGRDLSNL